MSSTCLRFPAGLLQPVVGGPAGLGRPFNRPMPITFAMFARVSAESQRDDPGVRLQEAFNCMACKCSCPSLCACRVPPQLHTRCLQHLDCFLLSHTHHGGHLSQALTLMHQRHDPGQGPPLIIKCLLHHNMVLSSSRDLHADTRPSGEGKRLSCQSLTSNMHITDAGVPGAG